MAFASSFQKAQIPVKCEVCEQGNRIRWRCKECELSMCDRCRDVAHVRIAKNHTVVAFNDIVNVKSSLSSKKTEIVRKPSKIVFKVMKERQLQTKIAKHFAFESEESIWIGYSKKGVGSSELKAVQNVLIINEGTEMIDEYSTEIYDIAIPPSGSPFIVGNSASLMIINSLTGQVVNSKYNTKPWTPRCVHVTSDKKVIIGATKEDVGVVLVIDEEGNTIASYGHDETGTSQLLYKPVGVASTKTGNIFVSDEHGKNKDTGKVVVIKNIENNISRSVHKYTGHPEINSKASPFNPNKVVSTPSDNVFIMDTTDKNIHILNNEGEIITYYSLYAIGIRRPWSIAISPSGKLFVGDFVLDDEDTTNTAKLYELEYYGV